MAFGAPRGRGGFGGRGGRGAPRGGGGRGGGRGLCTPIKIELVSEADTLGGSDCSGNNDLLVSISLRSYMCR